MFYTTRDPIQAEKFVKNMPFSEEEKAEIKSYFSTISNYMDEIKKGKALNSKGGERWIIKRIEEKLAETESLLRRFFSDLDLSPAGQAAQFLLMQSAITAELIKLGKESNVSEETLVGLEKYCELMNGLVKKYSGIDELLDNEMIKNKIV
jgi:uncharacterized protein YutE (UPF0331/DUF86 family)